ncbi:MAG TPA: hypothetical protein DDW94_02715 [Deltaproteobacteria bacterium]|nr:MAG: hypothetical protein A2Z79_09130 [Deltaproteobacteria bacterium GWA2_55_82]OGQ64627.1 MAG: hypothetical protein A3I81_11395 [Deltaproteobacteria bacterium RIFCSPLOWO2_02_FULL_55_12]OIJ73727.1 MAG: hypothetical protein A2V21_305265 [Deltaproteobacteria bacterium GWC2_55_46]HBG45879.1 hypothetical protein [Deltaproteobacteria bacterium]HCY09702.1 hypothetical protein [Deltaproteobacteria bacterium]
MREGGQTSGHRKRLKDRFVKSSLEGFHDYEVLELLLMYAIPRRDVKPLAKKLLSEFKGLKGVFEAAPGRLEEVSGLGEASALLFALVKEAAAAYLSEEHLPARGSVCSPGDAVGCLRQAGHGDAEGLFTLYLNSKNEVLGVEKVERNDAALSPKSIIQKAFSHNARSIILVSAKAGKGAATKAEKAFAQELQEAVSSIDILLHDYIVAGSDGNFSARETGWLKRVTYS